MTNLTRDTKQDQIRLYLDNADVNQWAEFWPLGIFYGITTNPKILHQAGLPCTLKTLRTVIEHAFQYNIAEFHAQAWGENAEEMLDIGQEIAAIHPKVIVKVPSNRAGFICARHFIEAGIDVTMTAVYAPEQVVAAGALGARYAAPYLGRINDSGADGISQLTAMQEIVARTDTNLLVASLRNASEIALLVRSGLRHFTFTPKLAYALIDHDLTAGAVDDFDRLRIESLDFETESGSVR